MAEATWTREDEGTDRERMVAERSSERLEVWYDDSDPHNPGWAFRLYRAGEGRESGPLNAEDEDGACAEAERWAGWTIQTAR